MRRKISPVRKSLLSSSFFVLFTLFLLTVARTSAPQWQASVELNMADASISVSFPSEGARKYEIFWSDSPFGTSMEWRRALKDIAADASGKNVWTDAGGTGRSHPAQVRTRFYHVALQEDNDRDGLTDAEEHFVHKTDPRNSDSDGDHLLDGDEVNVHGTDPLNADSDGGGMGDEDEVGFGFNPKDRSDDGQDNDSDGLSNAREILLHTNPLVADTDGDTLTDGQEEALKTDPCNADADADGLTDPDELKAGTDPKDADSDDDGMPDGWEVNHSLDPLKDNSKSDADGDSLVNLVEYALSTDPQDSDSDDDTLADGDETVTVFRTNAEDAAGDGKLDYKADTWIAADTDGDWSLEMYQYSEIVYYSGYGFDGTLVGKTSDGLDLYKKDGDLYVDVDDVNAADDKNELAKYGAVPGMPPSKVPQLPYAANRQERWRDRDGDGLIDALDTDSDGDGMPDKWEASYGFDPYDATDAAQDPDNDGLTNLQEWTLGTDPTASDSDGDIVPDGAEVEAETDPLKNDSAQDLDNDGLSNLTEYQNGTIINDPDSDDDGILDGSEPNWNADTDGDGAINALDPDSDNDGLSDGEEQNLGTDPLKADTDGDNVSDYDEVENGSNPNDKDSDDDTITDDLDPRPTDPDADDDGLTDAQEATLNAVWFKVSDLLDSDSVLLDDPDAKGGKCLVHKTGSAGIFDRSQQLSAGKHRLFVRAKTFRLLELVPNGDFEQDGMTFPPANWNFSFGGPVPPMAGVYPATPAFSGVTGVGISAPGVAPGAVGEWIQVINHAFSAGDQYTFAVSFFISPGSQGFDVDAGLIWKSGATLIKQDWSKNFSAAAVPGVWIPIVVSTPAPAGATSLEIHLRARALGQPAVGSVVFDEVVLARVGDKIQLSVIDSGGTDLTASGGTPDAHYVAGVYRWVSTPDFTLAADGTVRLVASDLQSAEGSVIGVDRAFVVKIENPSPKLTDPLDPDTDGDGIVDGAERTLGANWYQAEDFCTSNRILDYPGAANGKEVNPDAAGLLCRVTDDNFSADGDYTVYVRARTLNLNDNNNIRVAVKIGLTTQQYTIQPVRLVGLDTLHGNVPIFVNLYEWFAAVQPIGLPKPGLPSVISLPPSISVVGQTGIDIQVVAQGANRNNIRLDAVLLIHGPYSPTEINPYINQDGINMYERVLLNPRISNPMDPDTDLDGYRPKDGAVPGSKGYLTDGFEFNEIGSNAFAMDTDLDGDPDNSDINLLTDDSDNDGLKDNVELADGTLPGYPGKTNFLDADTDDDGILDGNEDVNMNQVCDAGETNPVVADTDQDGLLDGQEVGLARAQGSGTYTNPAVFEADADPSTRTNPLDRDSDEDGLLDGTEDKNANGSRDGTETDPSRFDTDNDGLSDGLELGLTAPEEPASTDPAKFKGDAHPSSKTDPLVADSDHDGLDDGTEDKNANGKVDPGETDPNNPDSDGDQLTDGEEVRIYHSNPLSKQSDQDGLSDTEEVKVYQTNPASEDTDGDGLWDGSDIVVNNVSHKGEMTARTDPRVADTDHDGLKDGLEVTGWSITVNGAAKSANSDPLNPDTDGDGLGDQEEYLNHTDPRDPDTDDDGLSDFLELKQYGSNPAEADEDDDGLNDAIELALGTNPRNADSDGDGLPDGYEDGNRNGVVDVCETDPTKRDTDGDGVTDDKEILYSSQMYSQYVFSWEAEQASHSGWLIGGVQRYAFSPVQQGDFIADVTSGASGSGAISTETSLGGVYVAKVSNVVANATYQFYVRLRIQPEERSGLTNGLVGMDSIWTTSREGYFVRVPREYGWFSTRPRAVDGSDITLQVWRGSNEACDVYVDRFILVRLDGAPAKLRGGQVTLPGPGNFDTDADGISDANEIKDKVYWIEAENLDLTNALVYAWNDGATNGRAVKPRDASTPVLIYNSASPPFNLEPGTYNLWVRARAFASPSTQKLTVRVEETPSVFYEKQFSFTDTVYYRWLNFNQAVGATDTNFDVKISCTGNVLVDRLMFASTSYGNLSDVANWGKVTDPLCADTDGGGSRDVDELLTSGDGKDNPLDPTDDDADSDGDKLSDAFENLTFGTADPDGDGLIPANDPDSDNDGLDDGFETMYFGLADPDGDGKVPALDADSDGDGLSDKYEVDNFGFFDVDGDGKVPALDADSDGDGLSDFYEDRTFGFNNPDGDKLPNGKPRIPALDPDSDDDGLSDYEEVYAGADGYTCNPLKADTDDDGIPDGVEVNVWGTNPSKADSDGDGLSDDLELAGWGLLIYSQRTGNVITKRRVYSDPLVQDEDGDGLSDYVEFLKSDPTMKDTDGDGYTDDKDLNPVGIENEAPTITYFSYSSDVIPGYYRIHVHVKAADQGSASKIQSIKVTVASAGSSDTETENDSDFEQDLHVQWFSGAVVSGFDIDVSITDLNGNVRKATKHLQSFLEWVQGGVEAARDWAADHAVYYELDPFPRYWQGPFGLCAALTCLEVAHYYFILDDLDDVSSKSGDSDVYNGMYNYEVVDYLTAIGVLEKEDSDPTFDEIKDQIVNQFDPVYGMFDDYYSSGSSQGHYLAIIGFYDAGPLGKYCIMQDTNVTVVTYPMSWGYLESHKQSYFVYVDGIGMAGP